MSIANDNPTTAERSTRESRAVGTLLGIAVGDALGLAYENMSPERGPIYWGPPDRYHFGFGGGLVSDDTEHACLTAQSLITSQRDPERFAHDLAARLRGWLLTFPLGGGAATYISLVRSWLGYSPATSGWHSAGNGPALRALVLGATIDDVVELRELVRRSTLITHSDEVAVAGAMSLALAVRFARQSWPVEPAELLSHLRAELTQPAAESILAMLEKALSPAALLLTTREFALQQGWTRGVSGYIVDSVAAALHAAFRHPHDLQAAVVECIEAGGDADSTAAMAGGFLGACLGEPAIPRRWLNELWEGCWSVEWITAVGERLARADDRDETPIPEQSYFRLLGRNLFFAVLCVGHVVRRWFPPYG